MTQLTIVMAQLNPLVGDIDGNTARAIAAIDEARRQHNADLVLFPELMLTGYPPEDLLLRPSIRPRIDRALAQLCRAVDEMYVVVGYPRATERGLFNMAGVIHRGQLIAEYAKQELPNYKVFDEKRYFQTGDAPCIVDIRGVPVAVTICEDIWHPAPMRQAAAAGARLMVNINASPFHRDKQRDRRELLRSRALEGGMPIVYVNMVSGQDELVFDGGSMVVDAAGAVQVAAPNYSEGLFSSEVVFEQGRCRPLPGDCAPLPAPIEGVYRALVLGVRDYVEKNRFPGVVLGLSGGIDSGLTLAIAVDALGAERVEAVMMPFRYTSQMSLDDAAQQAKLLGVNYRVISIEPIYDAFLAQLAAEFSGLPPDKTEENIQARCRGVLLMSISNKKGSLVLTTGNKSEIAVGYSTLYGDMAGGFDVLKDVPKTEVFALSRYRNTLSPAIPERVIERPPSAELAPGQTDQDSLPPYDELDRILERYVEQDQSQEAIVAAGFDRATVARVIRMVDLNEYKRRQAPIGPRITQRGFGRDRRYPITSGWQPGD